MFMRTRRLFLRPPFPEDWRDVYRGIANEGTVRMLARAPWPYEPQHARDFCNRPRAADEMGFAIVLPGCAGAPLVGQVGIDRREDGRYEAGYWIAEEHRGRGYAAEALAGVLEIAGTLGIPLVEAGHYLDNPASGRVLLKCGFRPTGAIEPTRCAGRGGESVPARRYTRDLMPSLPAAA